MDGPNTIHNMLLRDNFPNKKKMGILMTGYDGNTKPFSDPRVHGVIRGKEWGKHEEIMAFVLC